MTVNIGASGQPRVVTFPFSWSWYMPVPGGAPFTIGAGATITRDALVLDVLNNTGFGAVGPIPGDAEVVIGFEECFSINCASAGVAGVTLRRQFSPDGITWFTVVDTALAPNATTNLLVAGNLNRFPAYPSFRYQLINLDGVNVQTLNGVVTIRSR